MSNEAKLGTIPGGNEGRDAVHVAIIPVQAAQLLTPGLYVKLNAENKAEPSTSEAVGIVDPFLGVGCLNKDEWFWLCLFPKSVTSLRHVWEHPAFPLTNAVPTSTSPRADEKAKSKEWITNYVRSHCPYWESKMDYGYSEFIDRVKENREIFYYGSDCHSLSDVEDANELFYHLSVVLGIRINAEYFEWFNCSC